MKSAYQNSKEVILILAGALAGTVFVLFGNYIQKHIFWIVGILVILVLYGTGLLEWIGRAWLCTLRIINKKRGIIAICAPYEIDSDTSSWINLSLQQIKNSFIKAHIRCSFISKEGDINKYSIVINPYGGVYPEKNLSSLESLNAIFDYVRDGGIYINIADIPFYYAYDQNLGRRVDTTPLAGDFSQIRSFLQTLLTKKLQVFVFGLTTGVDFNQGIERIITLSKNFTNLFKKEIKIDSSSDVYSPQLAIPYGKGYFVFSTIQLNDSNLEVLETLIKKSFILLD